MVGFLKGKTRSYGVVLHMPFCGTFGEKEALGFLKISSHLMFLHSASWWCSNLTILLKLLPNRDN